jgi:hypothetical protein
LSVKELSQRWIERSIKRSSQALFQARQDRIGNWKGSNKTKATDSSQQAAGRMRKGGNGESQLTPGRSWRSWRW